MVWCGENQKTLQSSSLLPLIAGVDIVESEHRYLSLNRVDIVADHFASLSVYAGKLSANVQNHERTLILYGANVLHNPDKLASIVTGEGCKLANRGESHFHILLVIVLNHATSLIYVIGCRKGYSFDFPLMPPFYGNRSNMISRFSLNPYHHWSYAQWTLWQNRISPE